MKGFIRGFYSSYKEAGRSPIEALVKLAEYVNGKPHLYADLENHCGEVISGYIKTAEFKQMQMEAVSPDNMAKIASSYIKSRRPARLMNEKLVRTSLFLLPPDILEKNAGLWDDFTSGAGTLWNTARDFVGAGGPGNEGAFNQYFRGGASTPHDRSILATGKNNVYGDNASFEENQRSQGRVMDEMQGMTADEAMQSGVHRQFQASPEQNDYTDKKLEGKRQARISNESAGKVKELGEEAKGTPYKQREEQAQDMAKTQSLYKEWGMSPEMQDAMQWIVPIGMGLLGGGLGAAMGGGMGGMIGGGMAGVAGMILNNYGQTGQWGLPFDGMDNIIGDMINTGQAPKAVQAVIAKGAKNFNWQGSKQKVDPKKVSWGWKARTARSLPGSTAGEAMEGFEKTLASAAKTGEITAGQAEQILPYLTPGATDARSVAIQRQLKNVGVDSAALRKNILLMRGEGGHAGIQGIV